MSAPALERQTLTRHVSRSIRHALIDKDMNQADLARAMGKDEVWLSRRLNGHVVLNILELAEIAAILDVSISALLPRTADPVSSVRSGANKVDYSQLPVQRMPQSARRTHPIRRPDLPQTGQAATATAVHQPMGFPTQASRMTPFVPVQPKL